MTIRENILEVKKKVLADVVNDDKSFSEDLQNKAIAAILNGPKSEEWRAYMENFADPAKPDQLKRLMGSDGTEGDAELDRARAYLVADAPCTPITALNFGNFSLNRLDVGLDDSQP